MRTTKYQREPQNINANHKISTRTTKYQREPQNIDYADMQTTNTKIEIGIFGFLGLNFNTRKNKYVMCKSFDFHI